MSSPSVVRAEQLKEQANRAFASGAISQAVQLFSQAIQLNPTAIYFANRAACHLKTRNWAQAAADCEQALQLDPGYVKAKARYTEALIRMGRGSEASAVAQELYAADGCLKHHQLLDEAKRCEKLVDAAAGFERQLYDSAGVLLAQVAQLVCKLQISKFSLVSTSSRHENAEVEDSFDLERCGIVELAFQAREQIQPNLQMNMDDLKFLQKDCPGYRLSPSILCFYYLMLVHYQDFCQALSEYGCQGFPTEADADGKPKPGQNFQQEAQKLISSNARQGPEWMSYTACLAILAGQTEQAAQILMTVAQVTQDAEVAAVAQGLRTYAAKKDQGTAYFKSGQYTSAMEAFAAAGVAVFDAANFCNEAGNMNAMTALLRLCCRPLAAVCASNIGMAKSKAGSNGEALALLASAVLLDRQYFKAHIRAAGIYLDAKMWGECMRESGMAVAIDEKGSQGCKEQMARCQQELKNYSRRDYYSILGVPKGVDVSSAEYKKAYKKACLKYHPDRNRDPVKKRWAENKFRIVQEANEILSDPKKRQIYDAGGNPAQGGAEAAGGVDISEMFSQMGGMGGFPFSFFGGMPGNVQFQVVSGGPGRHGRGGRGGMGGMGGIPIDISQLFSMFGN